MRVTLTAVALACLAECAVVTPSAEGPTQPKTEGRKFTLAQVHNEHFRGHDVQSSLIRAHMKYGYGVPAALSLAAKNNPSLGLKFSLLAQSQNKTQKGTIKSVPPAKYDSEYAVPVQIGTPPQSLPLNLDTGSADLWVFSSETYRTSLHGQALYHPENSSSSHRVEQHSWKVKYGDGAFASGIVYKDRVQLGECHVDEQAVQAAIEVSDAIAADTFTSGILGMANSAANTVRPTRQKSYMDNLREQLEQPVFTANLHSRGPGNYNFGYIDKSEYTGKIQYAAVDRYSPFWKITVSGYQVGSGYYKKRQWNAIVDTGTSLLLLPGYMVDEYYSQIPGSGFDSRLGVITYPCRVHPPDFILGIGPYRGRIPGAYIKYSQVNRERCYGGIQKADKIPFAVLGDVALKAQFVVFNYNYGLVGFANKKLDDLSGY